MRILHALHMSLPAIAGYSIRTGYILRFQKANGLDPVVVTSAQDPNGPERELVDGILHIRTPDIKVKRPVAREGALLWTMERSVERAIRELSPDLVHAHSPVLVGLPAMVAARRHRLPFVYEVRDLWENASVDRGKFREDSLLYRAARGLENIVYRNADSVVAICDALREAITPRVGRNIPIHVVPNGVEVQSFRPGEPDDEVRGRWGLRNKRVIGYIGAFQPYEGLSVAVSAIAGIAQRIPGAHLMLTGAGGVEEELRAQVAREGLEDLVTFTGRVPHGEVQALYAIPEVFVYPRLPTQTTALTTPLKPLEAMATGKPVLVSDVGGMLELVQPERTGMVFRAGDVTDLIDKAVWILEDPSRSRSMSEAARAYVETERQWPAIVGRYLDIYRDLFESWKN